jgi:drug/metabolite transporter (DMT)-like permease
VPLLAIALVLAASILHVAWNSLVKTSGDPLETSTRAVALGALVLAPLAALAWLGTGRPPLEPSGWAIGVLSGLVEVAYFVALSAAYRHGAMSSVYPVARGTGAMLSAAIGVVVLGEHLSPAGFAGVVLLLAGIIAAALPGARRSTLVPALLTGCAIASYSALDRVGVRMGPAWLYAAVIWSVAGVGLLAFATVTRAVRRRSAGAETPTGNPPGAPASITSRAGRDASSLRRSMAAGLLMIATYMLVLVALGVAPLSGVGPLRESATVLAAAWGVVALGERDHAAWRLGGAVAVAIGSVLLVVGG